MLTKTKIKFRAKKKTSPVMQDLLSELLKHTAWQPVTSFLSGSTRNQTSINLDQIDSKTEIGDTALILGKVLSKGEITKKIKIVALSFSEKAREKAKESKTEIITILEEVKKNPKFEGLKIINGEN